MRAGRKVLQAGAPLSLAPLPFAPFKAGLVREPTPVPALYFYAVTRPFFLFIRNRTAGAFIIGAALILKSLRNLDKARGARRRADTPRCPRPG